MKPFVRWLTAVVLLFPNWATAEGIAEHPSQLQTREPELRIPTSAEHQHSLGCGSTVFIEPDSTLPLVEIVVALRSNKSIDPTGREGIAELTTAMLRRAGSARWSPSELDSEIERVGASIRTFNGPLHSAVAFSAPRWNLESALELFFDLLQHPRYDEERIELAQRNLRDALRRRNDDPLAVLEREWNWLLFGRSHFAHRPTQQESVERLTSEHLRAFHHRYWVPSNLVFAVSGDITEESILKTLELWCGRWPGPDAEGSSAIPWPPPTPQHEPSIGLFHAAFETPQAKVALGHRLPADAMSKPDRFALEVLGGILGGRGAISRIQGRLRAAEGLVYRSETRLEPGVLWPGDLRIFFEAAPTSVPRGVELVLEEVQRLRTDLVSPTELEVVRRTLLAETRLAFDTAEEVVGYLAEDELLGRSPEHRADRIAALQKVTTHDLLRVARQYLQPQNFTVLVVGPWPAVAGDRGRDLTALEETVGERVVHLPVRDPLTLLPVAAEVSR